MSLLLVFMAVFAVFSPVYAGDTPESGAFRSTDYPLPRFVSLRSDEVYVRTGPGQKYPVQWVFTRKALPVEITLEYDVWRKIKDIEGHEGWVHKSLLSGKRTGFIQSEDPVKIHRKPKDNSQVLAIFKPKVLVSIEECDGAWCHVAAGGYKGWMQQSGIWGVYEAEKFD